MALAAVAALTALAAVVTVHRGRYYATNHAFLQEWRATDPAPYHALAALGEEAHYASRWAEAERYYRAAVAVDPVAASFVYEPLGLTLEAQGKTAEAIEMYRTPAQPPPPPPAPQPPPPRPPPRPGPSRSTARRSSRTPTTPTPTPTSRCCWREPGRATRPSPTCRPR
nr:hypothetical protein [Deltaproteobacteria bacterium]